LKQHYRETLLEQNLETKQILQQNLRSKMVKCSIDVNIMAKVDKINVDANSELKSEIFSNALSSLQGFANSKLTSSVVLSAGMNPCLCSYLETFNDFLPDDNQHLKRK
jgi:hypothetical protein